MRRISVKLILLLATVAASPCWGQPPTISSLQSSPLVTVPYDVTGITSATPLQAGGFYLYVNSTLADFDFNLNPSVTWNGTPLALVIGVPQTNNQLTVFVPNALFQTAVANPVAVAIVVHETGLTSNAATFTINPPLQAIQPILPSGTLNQSYSANLFSGGTPPFSEAGVTNPANLPPGITSPFPSITISGTPTQTGVFTGIQTAATDFWGNVAGGADTLEIVAVPTLTSLLPNTSGTGAGNLTMTLNGTNFVGPAPAPPVPGSQVQWTAGGVTTPLATAFNNNTTQLTATVPSALLATPGVASVTVVQPGGATSNALPFSVLAPSISTILPVSVPAGSSATVLTVNGANFVVNAALSAVSTVTLNGTALATTFVNSGTLTATVPAGMLLAPIVSNVQVVNPGGTASNVLLFSVLAPAIATLSTTSLPAGSPAFVLTVTGANYLPGSQISFRGTALATTFVNGTTLTAIVTANLLTAAGQVNVLVTNPGGTNSNTAPFNVLAPVIGSLSPPSVLAGVPGFTLAVTGANFVAGSQVSFDANPLTTSFVSPTLLNASVPAALVAGPKVASITVANPGGSVSAGSPFTVQNSLAIATISLPPGNFGIGYKYTLTGTGGTPPYTWSASGLPYALSVNSGTGAISGVIQAGGTFVVTVVLRDAALATANAQFTLVVGPPPVTILPSSSMPSGVVGVIYQGFVYAYGGTGSYTYSLGGGSLPDGVTLASNGSASGTPKTPGQFSFSVVATDTAGASASASFSVTIQPAPLSIAGGPTGPLAAGTPINISFTGTGGVGPYKFSLSGSLPPGTAFNNGVLSGTPTTVGAYTFHVTITDSTGLAFSSDFTLTLTPAVLSLGGTLSGGKVGVPYVGQISAKGGVGPYSYAGSGLPGGLSLSADGGISGTPTTAGQFTLMATVTDSKGATASGKFAITIAPADLGIVTASLPDGVLGVAYTAALSASGGIPPYTWTVTGLPAGVTAAADGTIGGTPTAAGKFTVSATVKDASGATAPGAAAGVSKSFSLTIAPAALIVTTASAPNGTVGTAYAASFAASGGIAPYTFSASGLPAGLSMSAAGAISGTPTAPGAATIVVTVKDSSSASTSRSFAVTIGLPPAPPLSFNIAGISDTASPLQQPRLQVTLGSAYPVDVVVTLTLTFTPDSGGDDPTIQFSSGGRTARITVPAGATTGATDVGVQTGTVAGLIAITAQLQASGQDITPSPAPRRTIRIAAATPVIVPGTLTAVRNGNGFTVTLIGYVTDRELTQAIFVFAGAAGGNLQTTTLTVPLDAMTAAYFGGSSAAPFGSQFTYTQPFTVNGSTQSIVSVTVTLVNQIGQSTPVTATLN